MAERPRLTVPIPVPIEAGAERRRHPRVVIGASADVTVDGVETRYVVENLSAGGAFISGGPTLFVGQPMEIALRLPPEVRVRARAKVVRHAILDWGTGLGVEFEPLSAEVRAAIDAFVDQTLRRFDELRASPGVLIVVADATVRDDLHRAVAAQGRNAVATATPEEAMRWLCNPQATLDTLVVDVAVEPDGATFLTNIAKTYPHLRRILLAGKPVRSPKQRARIRGAAHAVLTPPVAPDALSQALTGRRP